MAGRTARLDWLLGRHVSGTFLVLLALVGVMAVVRIRVLQVPGYLVLVGFDLIQNPLFPGLSGSGFTALFALYLYSLAVLVGNGYRWMTRRGEEEGTGAGRPDQVSEEGTRDGKY